jgi:hypothetical protein
MLPYFPPFECEKDPSILGERWKKWKSRFLNFLTALNVKDETRKRALLLHYVGESASDIFDTLPETGEDKDFKLALEKFDEYFTPKQNTAYSVYLFRQSSQENEDSLDQFCTRLRQKAKYCNFTDLDSEIKQQIIQGCKSTKLRRRALREPSLSLQDLFGEGRCRNDTQPQWKKGKNCKLMIIHLLLANSHRDKN